MLTIPHTPSIELIISKDLKKLSKKYWIATAELDRFNRELLEAIEDEKVTDEQIWDIMERIDILLKR